MVAAGLQTLQQYWARRGYDWKVICKQLASEKKFLEDNELSFGEVVKRSITETVDNSTDANPPVPSESQRAQELRAQQERVEATVRPVRESVKELSREMQQRIEARMKSSGEDLAKLEREPINFNVMVPPEAERKGKRISLKRGSDGRVSEIEVGAE
jgi:hypothetical protein